MRHDYEPTLLFLTLPSRFLYSYSMLFEGMESSRTRAADAFIIVLLLISFFVPYYPS
ncbi:hypothetical protein BO78DRAFT_137339 [Aspergillus sclerotiicarbonarius CBS 121057]|uniref:Uncharacterized protein n=1 Tax=Aspergillus sclerotiicarbonarius (strain CBS 121057 / IBT 28362) TaxID=1448318 RepID=A0A319E7Q4_ASPSB|nr:hypothetical protein BO78DRAFT_137339 [Aspergillus sclerotiicarbonarius CBS 121057]